MSKFVKFANAAAMTCIIGIFAFGLWMENVIAIKTSLDFIAFVVSFIIVFVGFYVWIPEDEPGDEKH